MSVDDWSSEVKLGCLIEHQKGFAFKSSEYEPSGHPVIRVSNFTDRSIDTSDCKFISPSKVKDFEAFTLNQGDVIIATVGSWPSNPASVVGKAICVSRELDGALLNQNAVRLSSNGRINQKFLFHLLRTQDFQDYIVGTAQGSANQASITLQAIFDFTFNLPPLDEQKAIAHILGTLDDKIELNQQMNQTLEAMARAIFKSWFVDFDPVRAKLEGRQPANMDAETAALFPAEFEDGGEGKGAIELIPKGWQVGRLDDLLVLQRGFDLPTSQRTPGMYPVIAASGFSGTHSEFRVEGPGVVTGRSGVLGKVFFVHEDFWALNTALWVKEFRISRPIHAYHLLQGLELATFNAGSAVPTLNRNHVHGLPMVLPPIEVVQAFEALVTPIFQRCRANEKEAFTLATIRDALLPKLLSGELPVKDAEKLVEAVT